MRWTSGPEDEEPMAIRAKRGSAPGAAPAGGAPLGRVASVGVDAVTLLRPSLPRDATVVSGKGGTPVGEVARGDSPPEGPPLVG
mmetsp:Transcript_149738/g.264803  ORF Transcript_149738/g.264803 Transcript_149738/m.264803 type:complete len:84 (-) Transcript_149738:596-847(-)